MGRGVGLYLLMLVALCGAAAAEEHVLTLTGDNFSAAVADNPWMVVEFYAPWCGHCKKLTPEYEKAAKQLKELGLPVALAKVDATEEKNKALASRYDVKGYPTLKIFKDGDEASPSDYNGPREAAGIVSYVKKQSGPALVSLKTEDEVKAFKALGAEKDSAVVAVLPEGEDSKEFKAFELAAKALRDDFELGYATDAKLVEDAADATAAVVLLYKDFDEPMVRYLGDFEAEAIQAWVSKMSTPPIAILDQNPKNRKVMQKVFASQDPKVLGFVHKDSDMAGFKAHFIATAKAVDDGLHFIFAESSANNGALQYFGLKDEDVPAYVIHDSKTDAKYVRKNADPADLTKFLSEFKEGKLERTIKSEEPPKDNSGPVTVLTAKTYDEIVNSGKDVLIEFYAPWCGHCKKLTPIYEEVGAEFKENETIVIAKMDATANDIPTTAFKVSGFPTIKMMSGGNYIDYSGDRSKADLIKFVKSNAKSAAGVEDEKDEL